jgi:hypothetical protein
MVVKNNSICGVGTLGILESKVHHWLNIDGVCVIISKLKD